MNLIRQPEETSGSIAAKKMTNRALAARVKKGFQKIRGELPYIKELRDRFAALPRGSANIDGCKTWTDFCERRLHRTDRRIRQVLAEDETGISVRVEPVPKALIANVRAEIITTEQKYSSVSYVEKEPEPEVEVPAFATILPEEKPTAIVPIQPEVSCEATSFYHAHLLTSKARRFAESFCPWLNRLPLFDADGNRIRFDVKRDYVDVLRERAAEKNSR